MMHPKTHDGLEHHIPHLSNLQDQNPTIIDQLMDLQYPVALAMEALLECGALMTWIQEYLRSVNVLQVHLNAPRIFLPIDP